MRHLSCLTSVSKNVFVLSVLMLFASCGGGGSSGDDQDQTSKVSTLNEYGFTLSFVNDDPVHLNFAMGSAVLEATTGASQFSGSYTLDTETVILDDGPMVKVTTDLWDASLGVLSINVINSIKSTHGNSPNEGEVSIAIGIPPDYEYFVTVNIADTRVNIHKLGDPVESASYTWDEFGDLLGSDTPVWHQQASFALSIVDFFFNQLELDVKAMTLIEENQADLETGGGVAYVGDIFPGEPPSGHTSSGHFIIGPFITSPFIFESDHFYERFYDYWKNDLSNSIDKFYNGTVEFIDLIKTYDETWDLLSSFGFVTNYDEDQDPFSPSGNVPLTIYETEETSPGVFTVNDEATISMTGRYSIMFHEPE